MGFMLGFTGATHLSHHVACEYENDESAYYDDE
jgi:hypothetical protein